MIYSLRAFTTLFIIVLLLGSCNKNPTGTGNNEDEERILFIRNSREFSEICTMKPDGSDKRIINRHNHENGLYHEGYLFARWSPDKSKIVVQGGPGSTLEYQPLWLMDMEGNLLYKLIWNGYMPIWTSDGENVLYTRRRGYFSETYDIYMTNINSLQEDIVLVAEVGEPGSNSGYMYQLLDIFPYDNSKLLLKETYTYRDTSGMQHDNDAEIIVYDYLINQKTYYTNNDLEEGWARVSPDESTIVYLIRNVETIRYSNNLYLMTIDGDSIRQLTSESNTDAYLFLAWSPSSEKIACSKSDQSNGYNPYDDIFIIDIQSGAFVRVTNTVQDSITNYVVDWK